MIRLASLAAVVAALLTAGPAAASPFGQSVAACARTSLPPQPSPPGVTCSHGGETHPFTTFGKMVAHTREHGG